jgi:hypothetical protein
MQSFYSVPRGISISKTSYDVMIYCFLPQIFASQESEKGVYYKHVSQLTILGNMITRNTVFILGAGASVPYGFPSGETLRLDICKKFVKRIISLGNIPHHATAEIKDIVAKARPFCDAFFKSSTHSIDLFLARNILFSEIGKMAIVSSILEAEKNSAFREDMSDQYKSQDWYSYLFKKMTEDLTDTGSYRNFGENKVTFITFNYDRSLEYFLYESLSNAFNSARKDEIIDQLRFINIFHVYGVIDNLPWQGGGTEYKVDSSLAAINRMRNNIRLIHERINSESREMKRAMRYASRFYFLGFGYAEENLDILGISSFLDGHQDIYGTAFGMTEKEISEKRSYLRKNFKEKDVYPHNPIIAPVDSYKLLRDWL